MNTFQVSALNTILLHFLINIFSLQSACVLIDSALSRNVSLGCPQTISNLPSFWDLQICWRLQVKSNINPNLCWLVVTGCFIYIQCHWAPKAPESQHTHPLAFRQPTQRYTMGSTHSPRSTTVLLLILVYYSLFVNPTAKEPYFCLFALGCVQWLYSHKVTETTSPVTLRTTLRHQLLHHKQQ